MPIRYKVIALHAALWQERRKTEELNYVTIIGNYELMLAVYEGREKKVRGRPEAP